MWAKAKTFGDAEAAEKILAVEDDPMECKKLGRSVKGYDDREWDKVRYQMMYEVNYERFSQDSCLRQLLLSSEYDEKMFVEASPYDSIWGIKLGLGTPVHILDDEKNWNGQNLLGKVLTEVRQYLKNAE